MTEQRSTFPAFGLSNWNSAPAKAAEGMAVRSLSKSERGLVVCAPASVETIVDLFPVRSTDTLLMPTSKDGFERIGHLDLEELRFSLLLWDHLVWPDSAAHRHSQLLPDPTAEEQFLLAAGVLSRPQVPIYPNEGNRINAARALVDVQLNVFRALEKREPGGWMLATGDRSLNIPDDQLAEGRAVALKLHRAIPIPGASVPLEEVLRFRERRRPEWLAVRSALDDLYRDVVNCGDNELALRAALDRVDQACVDAITVARESQRPWHLVSLRTFVEAASAAYGVYETTSQLVAAPLPMVAGAITGAAYVGCELTSGLRGARQTGVPYRYVAMFHDELV